MAAKGAKNLGGTIQQGWQNVPGSAKVGAGAGMMAGLAVGGAKKGLGAASWAQQKTFGAMQKTYGGWIIIFPILLAILDYVTGKNGIPLDFLFNKSDLFVEIATRIVVDSPYWVFLAIFVVLRKPFGRPDAKNEILFLAIYMFIVFFTIVVGGANLWIFYHLGFALLTFAFLLRGFNSDEPIGQRHWIFLIILAVDIFGLATFKGMYDSGFFAFTLPGLFLNRILFPWWFFYYLALIKDSGFKTGATIFIIVFYGGYIGFEYVGTQNIDLQGLTTEKEQAGSAIVKSITNWGDFAKQWFTQRINYAITGKVEENQYEPLGVYLENVQSADTKYYLDENVVVWGTVKARTLDDPINIKVGCFTERDKKKLPADDVDPKKKFSVFTLEEQDFACTFNGAKNGVASKLKEGTNTVKAFADFNFETLSYLKVYFIDKERQRAMTREGLDIFEEFDITDKNPVAVYTNGPAKIEMGTTNPLVGVSESYPAEPSLGIDISNREGWQGKITKLKELVLFLPDGINFDTLTSCINKEFKQYTRDNCKIDSCTNIVQKECLEVCEGYQITLGECNEICKDDPSGNRCSKCTESVTKLNACDETVITGKGKCKDNPFAEMCIECKKAAGIDGYNSCTNDCTDNLNKCKDSCDAFFEEGAQKYNAFSLKPDSYKDEKDFEKGIQLRCRFRPQPSILGNAPLTTKSFRVKARYQYNVEKSVSVNIQKDESSGGEGFVGAPLNLRIKGSDGTLIAEGSVTLGSSITIVWDKSINDGGGSNDVIRYRIYRKDGDTGKFNQKGEVDAKGTASYEYIDNSVNLVGNFKYSYYVDALNNGNKFEKSAVILEVTPGKVDSVGQQGGAGVPPGSVVMLYEDTGYKGNVLSIKGDVSDLGAVDFKAASSFRINEGYVATLYEHKDFEGNCFSDVVSRPDLGKIAFGSGTMNDAVSSVKVSAFKGAVLYADKDYQGMSSYYGADDNNFNGDCGGNDISSIRVAPGYRAILFKDADFNGVSGEADCNNENIKCVDNDITNLEGISFNDEPSSIRIVKKVPEGALSEKQ